MPELDIPILLHINHKSVNYDISLLPDETLEILYDRIYEKTAVPPSFQKLLYKGKKANVSGDTPILETGLQNGTKVMVLGSTEQEIGVMKAAEAERKRKEEIIKQRASRGTTKVNIHDHYISNVLTRRSFI